MASTAHSLIRNPKLTVSYDRAVDVLHIGLGEAVAYEGDGRADGIELDYSLDDDSPCGAKVIGFRKYAWPERLPELAGILGDHLAVDDKALVDAIARQTRK